MEEVTNKSNISDSNEFGFSKHIKESKIVRYYLIFLIGLIILLGIGVFIYLSQKFSIILSLLFSIIIVGALLFKLVFRAKFLLLNGFIVGNKKVIKFTIGAIIISIIALSILYERAIERFGLALFLLILIFAFGEIIISFLRLKELKNKKP